MYTVSGDTRTDFILRQTSKNIWQILSSIAP